VVSGIMTVASGVQRRSCDVASAAMSSICVGNTAARLAGVIERKSYKARETLWIHL
jgi:hypothetical protein